MAGSTPNFGIPLYDNGVPADWVTLFNGHATALDSALKTALDTALQNAVDEINEKLDPLVEDTDWTDDAAGILSIASGWSLETFWIRRFGITTSFYVRASRTGASISVGTSGDITNTLIGSFASGWTPTRETVLSSGNTGRTATGFVTSAGSVTLAAVGGSKNIDNGDDISLGGMFFR